MWCRSSKQRHAAMRRKRSQASIKAGWLREAAKHAGSKAGPKGKRKPPINFGG